MKLLITSFDRVMRAAMTLVLVLAASVTVPMQTEAKTTSYTDVQAGAYYEDAAAALLLSGALDPSETRLRPSDSATRAEVMKMLVSINGEDLVWPVAASFSDVSRTAWYFPYVEVAARAGWLRGDGDCYGTGRACTARPSGSVNRAEMAAILQRTFRLSSLGLAPVFSDNRDVSTWFYLPIQIAADHCILGGDGDTGLVRPSAKMNRAEMIVMFFRAMRQQQYGQNCAEPIGALHSISSLTSQDIQATFNVDMDPNVIGLTQRYSLETTGGSSIGITNSSVVNTRTVSFHLNSALQDGATYRLRVHDMRTKNGNVFSDTQTFVQHAPVSTLIKEAIARSATVVRLTFNTDVSTSTATNKLLYSLRRTDSNNNLSIRTVTMINNRTVDIELNDSLAGGASYSLAANSLRTASDTVLSGTTNFTFASVTTGDITTIVAVSPNRMRITFNTDLDVERSQQTIRYFVADENRTLNIRTAGLLSDRRTVELELFETLRPQAAYTVNVIDMLTLNGSLFSANGTMIDDASSVAFSALLTGVQEVPSVNTTATGTGTFSLTASGLAYTITLKNLSGSSFTGAHFHSGAAGINGPIIQSISFTGNTASGTWTNLSSEHRNALLQGNVYVNVHTAAYANGEIRGQMLKQ
jgi:hypothetical protein